MLPKNFVWRLTRTKSILQVISNGTVTGRITFLPLQIPIDFPYRYLMGDNCEDARSRNGVERCCVLPQGRVFRRPRLVGLRQLVQKHFPDGIPAQASLLGHLSAGVAFIEHFPANHRPLSNVVIHGKPRQSRIENAASRRDRSPNPRLSFYIAPCLLPKGDQGWCPKRGSPALSLYPPLYREGYSDRRRQPHSGHPLTR
jgi:hypothetical protein